MSTLTGFQVQDIRFPTSQFLDGSDAMNPDPDYSAAYLRLTTDASDGLEGHGFVFTIGRGNDVQTAAIRLVASMLVGRTVESLTGDMGETSRRLVHDSQLRWHGPEKGTVHMAIGAVVNALWDLKAKRARQPLWRLLSHMTPHELADLIDFRYLESALSYDDAVDILASAESGRAQRETELLAHGYPAYTTAPGWLGYDDAKLERLCREALADGFTFVKLKVGANREDDIRRLALARATVGTEVRIAIDANQFWEVSEAIEWIGELSPFGLEWVEEPTSPDDILGHATIARAIAPVPVATGEHAANRVMFRQFLETQGLSVLQIDATRVGGVNENIANLLLAAKFGVRVCPHAGGVGLCEAVQHFAMFDFVAVSGSIEGRYIEHVGHLHEHFVDPIRIRDGRYLAPEAPGNSMEMLIESRSRFSRPLEFPDHE